MMSPDRKGRLKAHAESLQRRAERALKFWGVRSLLLSEVVRCRPHPDFIDKVKPLAKGQRYLTAEESTILKMKGNPAIKMNDLFRVTNAEFTWLLKVAPHVYTRWCRTIDYPEDMWWSDPDRPVDAKTPSVRENWNAARTLALGNGGNYNEENTKYQFNPEAGDVGDDLEDDQPSLEGDTEADENDASDGIVARNQGLREELAEELDLDRPNTVQGDDYWTETDYPVLESQASFSAHGSNEDLNDLFGEEPRDERDQVLMRIMKSRGWRAPRIEESFQEGGIRAYHPAAFIMPSSACPELFGDQIPPKFNEDGQLIAGFFITRSEYFAQRDMMLQNLTWEYDPKPQKRRSPGPLDLEVIRAADRRFREAQPKAPEKPFLKKGQRHLGVIRGEFVKPSLLCSSSDH